MKAYIDCEFTSLEKNPLLLSIGLVVDAPDGDRDFYAEALDKTRLKRSSEFTKELVLPQFNRLGPTGTYLELCHSLATFVSKVVADLPGTEVLEICFDYKTDWDLFVTALQEGLGDDPLHVEQRLRPVNVLDLLLTPEGEAAAGAYFDSQFCTTIERHHALCDARALKIACAAART